MEICNTIQSGAIRALQCELKKLKQEPVEGFKVMLPNDADISEWEVAIFGPPGTLYEGGYFKLIMKFPSDYPYSPPSVRFLSKMTHPNIYENGEVCISILHSPINDPHSGELPSERWNPTQTVRTVLLSIISMLNEPNTMSPANVDASVMYRSWKDSNGRNHDYADLIRHQVGLTKAEALKDNVSVPMTVAEYCTVGQASCSTPSYHDTDDFYNETYMCESDDSASAFTDEEDEDVVVSDTEQTVSPICASLSCEKSTRTNDGNDSGNAEW